MPTIRLRRGDAATWASVNPTLASGEAGFETDTHLLKIGDGTTAWNSLAYVNEFFTGDAGDIPFTPAGTISATDVQGALAELDTELPDRNARVGVRKNSAGSTFLRRRINLIEGSNVTLTVADDSGSEEVDVTIAASSSGSVATDAIWDAKGDLAAGTGADTASKLTVGSNDKVLLADSSQATGLRWGDIDGGGA